jgi:hypothetical protein
MVLRGAAAIGLSSLSKIRANPYTKRCAPVVYLWRIEESEAGEGRFHHVAGTSPGDTSESFDRLADALHVVGYRLPAIAGEADLPALVLKVDGYTRIFRCALSGQREPVPAERDVCADHDIGISVPPSAQTLHFLNYFVSDDRKRHFEL